MISEQLIDKYNIPVPRYTSYPTVPNWKKEEDNLAWKACLMKAKPLLKEGISLYIHLPFCESLCTYCGCNKRITKNHGVESPYLKAILKEWEMYLELLGENILVKEIHLGGGTPTFFSPDNLDFLMTGLFSKAHRHPEMEGSFEGHPNNTSQEHLKVLYQHGFKRVSFGVQDLDLRVQKAINRIQPESEVEKVTHLARTVGYESVNFDLIYGLPFQHQENIQKTIASVIRLQPERIAFYSYAHVPWTSKSQRAYSEDDLPKGKEKMELYQTGKAMLLAAGYKDIGMDHFARDKDQLLLAKESGTLHRNFMGYTTTSSKVLIGLGVSAISDAYFGYRQNEKTVEEYYQRLDKNELPIIKGIDLSKDDIQARQHILAITCQHQTKWNKNESLSEPQKDYLQTLLDDGLVNVKGESIIVTKLGESFLRNIAALFDETFVAQTSKSEQVFSKAI